ncbi:MAG: pyridoxamine 5'-phosphate oxidase family protein [Verrucomicrobiales bacterium]
MSYDKVRITDEVAEYIDSSVLCWLATVSGDGVPNVSPKEAFVVSGEGRILVANIASPQSIRNIQDNNKVCLSFVNVFVQKGYKVSGEAAIVREDESRFPDLLEILTALIGNTFRIVSIIEITPNKIDQIIAPSYRVFPESTELDRIRESLGTYAVADYQKRLDQGLEEP